MPIAEKHHATSTPIVKSKDRKVFHYLEPQSIITHILSSLLTFFAHKNGYITLDLRLQFEKLLQIITMNVGGAFPLWNQEAEYCTRVFRLCFHDLNIS